MRKFPAIAFSLTLGWGQTTGLTPERVMTLAKQLFRDSAELPMDVTVTTAVTNAAGKEKHRATSTVLFVFKGYNQEAGHFSFNGHSGWFNTWALRDSLTGHFAAYIAGTRLAPKKGEPQNIEIREPRLVLSHDENCAPFELLPRFLYPKRTCASAEFRLGDDGTFKHFTLNMTNLPAQAKVVYLGDVRITGFHVEEDFQQSFLPGDPKPFLLPKRVETTVTTDRGKIVISNVYAPKAHH